MFWLTNLNLHHGLLSFTGFLLPAYEDTVYTITQPIVLGEVVTMLWLVIMGAKERRFAPAS